MDRWARLLFYDDVSPEVIDQMGYRKLKRWAPVSEIKLKLKYPNIESWK